jgi:hypothetical protein
MIITFTIKEAKLRGITGIRDSIKDLGRKELSH